LVVVGCNATKHLAAIFHGCHQWMCCNRKLLPLENYVVILSYYHEDWSIAIHCSCNISDMVAIDDMLMQRTSLRVNICILQCIHVGDDKGHKQPTIIGGNSWYYNATNSSSS
jgi:hypothetical protein